MRGTLTQSDVAYRMNRFIPAHAGNSTGVLEVSEGDYGSSPRMRGTPRQRSRRRPARTVHPRACGELENFPWTWGHPAGSSPRMRGTHHDRWDCLCRLPVHPRACGELFSFHDMIPCRTGSSPRMRGTRPHRFIPAHAGNSTFVQEGIRASSVHPRACGELLLLFRLALRPAGSSPRRKMSTSLRHLH